MSAAAESRPRPAPKRKRPPAKPVAAALVPKPPFELTEEEMQWAIRFFTAARCMDAELRRTMLDCYGTAVSALAEQRPLRKPPKLRLVAGGRP